EAARLNLGQQVLQEKDVAQAVLAYDNVVKRFPLDTWAPRRDTQDARIVAGISGEALFSAAAILANADSLKPAQAKLETIRRSLPGSDVAIRATFMEAQIYGAFKQPSDAAKLLADIAASCPPVSPDGRSPQDRVLQSPLAAAGWYLAAGDTVATSAEV